MKDQRGLSAIEAMVGILIFGVVAAAAVGAMSTGGRVFSRESTIAALQADLAAGHSIVLEEVMLAGYSPDGVATGTTSITDLTTSSSKDRIQFVADVDSDGISERITYAVVGNLLRRTVEERSGGAWGAPATETVLSAIESFELKLFSADRVALGDAVVEASGTTAARYLQLTLTTTGSARGETFRRKLSGEVSFRN